MIPKDAIEILKGIQDNLEETRFLERCALDMAIESLKDRPHGEWIETYYSIDGVGASRFKCSKCGKEISTYGEPYNFCHNCGSDNRPREGDEND